MQINAVFCKSCHNIIYSRASRDYRTCDCGKVAIDGGFDLVRVIGYPEDYMQIELDGKVMLKQILEYDYVYKNNNAKEFPNGYYGRYKIDKFSNKRFYDRLIISDSKNEILDVIE